jgi:hypothetical protein
MKTEANRHRAPPSPAIPHGAFRFAHRARQRGQAILWFLATAAACCAALALVYNVGQVTNEKEKTINAADAAALSGALVEARILNFEAYTNRAMIANEVTIAQLVSLDSWIRYDATMMQYIADYTAIIPYVNDVTSALAQGAQIAQNAVDTAVPPAIQGLNLAIDALKAAREAANFAAPAAAMSVASGIAKANQTTFGGRFDTQPELNPAFEALFLVKNTNDWLNFTKAYDGNDRGNAKDVILNSRDQFSTERGAGKFIDITNDLLMAAGLLASAGTMYTGFEKTSGTTTLTDYDHWAAQDSLDPFVATLQFCSVFGIPTPIPCGYEKTYVPVPIAYGRADADTDGSVGKDLCHPSFFTLFGTTLNCTLAVQNANVMSSDGIPNIRDVANPGGPNTPDPTLTFVAGVQKSADATLTTQRIGPSGMKLNTVDAGPNQPQGMPKLQDNLQNGDRLTSIAFAKVFNARPDWNSRDITEGNLPRPDRKHEYASLYNPYWQARLTQADDATRAAFYTVIGSNPLLSVFTP